MNVLSDWIQISKSSLFSPFFGSRSEVAKKSYNLYLCKKKKTNIEIRMFVHESFDQFRNTSVLNYLNESMIFEFGNLNDGNLTSITGFKSYKIDDFKNLFNSIIMKVIMGILFLIVFVFKNFQELVLIDVGHP